MGFSILRSFAVLASIALTPTASFAQEVTLRFQHIASAKAPVPMFFMEPWVEKIEKNSGGRIKMELYPHMQLGGEPPSLVDQIRDGVVDGGQALPPYTPGRFPETEAFELPFMTSNSAEASWRSAWEYSQKHLVERFSEVHILAVHISGSGVIHKKGGPIMSVADFSGLKLRGPSRQAINCYPHWVQPLPACRFRPFQKSWKRVWLMARSRRFQW